MRYFPQGLISAYPSTVYWPILIDRLKAGNNKNEVLKTEKDQAVVIRGDHFVTDIVVNFAVLLTFGLSCPSLSLLIAISSGSGLLRHKILLTRYLTLRSENGLVNDPSSCDNLIDLDQSIQESYMTTIWASGVFWGLICFDIASDVAGSLPSLWTLLVALIYPIIIYVTVGYILPFLSHFDSSGMQNNRNSGARLTIVELAKTDNPIAISSVE